MIKVTKPFLVLISNFQQSGRFFKGEAVNGTIALADDVEEPWDNLLSVAAGGDATLASTFRSKWDAFINDLNDYYTSTSTTPYVLPRSAQALWFDVLAQGNLLQGTAGNQSLTTAGQSAINDVFDAVASTPAIKSTYNSLLTETITQVNAINLDLTIDDIGVYV